MGKLDGRVAVITGAGRGIGAAVAEKMAAEGAAVVVNDLVVSLDGSGQSTGPAQEVAERILVRGGKAVASTANVTSFEETGELIQTAIREFGRLDVLVNVAGIIRDALIFKMTEEQWDAVIAVHLKGTFNTTRHASVWWRENRGGHFRIINFVSGSGLFGSPVQPNYAAAKMGMVGLMNTLAVEHTKNNIKFNAIAPNAASRMTEKVLPPPLFEKLKPEHIVPAVMWLASEQNQDTGMIINCMGGWYSRAAIVCAKGIIIGDGHKTVTAEDIQANWDTIKSLDEAKPLGSIIESFGYVASLLNK